MGGMRVYRLAFTLRAVDWVEFGVQAGSQIRGALYDALRWQACSAPDGRHDPGQADLCPVCWLMAREDPQAGRGKDVPRAFTVLPPPHVPLRIPPGELFEIGLTLFGTAVRLVPYLVQAFPYAGERGIGYGRGRFALESIEAVQPLTGIRQYLMQPRTGVVRRMPDLAVTSETIGVCAEQISTERLTIRFLTPMRLIDGGQLVKTPLFRALVARLLERFDLLTTEYGDGQ